MLVEVKERENAGAVEVLTLPFDALRRGQGLTLPALAQFADEGKFESLLAGRCPRFTLCSWLGNDRSERIAAGPWGGVACC